MDSWHPDIREALRMQEIPSRTQPHAGVELDKKRLAKRNLLFQLIENQPIGTVDKVVAMQRVMAGLIAEQIEVNQLNTVRPVHNEPLYPISFPDPKHCEAGR